MVTPNADESSDPRLAELHGLADQTTHNYAVAARKILDCHSHDPGYLAWLQNTLDSEMASRNVRFACFYLLQARDWQQRNYTDHGKRTDSYRLALDKEPLFPFVEAEYFLARSSKSDAAAALEMAREAKKRVPNTPGVLNLYGETVAQVGEEFPDLVRHREILEAENSMRKAQTKAEEQADRPYAKYSATLARLQALRGEWAEARRSISQAIDQEDSERSDYALRMIDYQITRAKITIAAQSAALREQQESALAEMRDARKDTLQVLGLLAAVIAFLVTTVNIASNFPPRAASALLMVSSGTLLLVFIGYAALFSRATRSSVLTSLAVAILLLGGGAALGAFV